MADRPTSNSPRCMLISHFIFSFLHGVMAHIPACHAGSLDLIPNNCDPFFQKFLSKFKNFMSECKNQGTNTIKCQFLKIYVIFLKFLKCKEIKFFSNGC